jgi:hypothetical protein
MKYYLVTSFLICLFCFDSIGQTNDFSVSLSGSEHITADGLISSSDTAFTIFFWTKMDSNATNGTFISNWASIPGCPNQQFKFQKSNDNIYVYSTGVSANYVGYSLPPGYGNEWYHVAYTTHVSDSNRLYINGVQVDKKPSNGTFCDGFTPTFSIGAEVGGLAATDFFVGLMDEVGMWNYPLSVAEINQYMQCPPNGTETGLLGFWDFEEGTGVTSSDLTANSNNASFVGSPAWSTDTQPYNCGQSQNVEEFHQGQAVVYPNPVSGSLTVDLKDYVGPVEIRVYDIDLSLLGSCNERVLDMFSYRKGVYILEIEYDGRIEVLRVVKH